MRRDPQALQGREHDVLVIGGGIAGAWLLWEAASRGLKAALIEIEDFGQSTSWSSMKTAHGGLRHLQRLDLAGFRESVRERRTLLRVAPEIVRPLGFAIAADGALDQARFFLGGLANDLLSPDRNQGLRPDRAIGASRLMSRDEARSLGLGDLTRSGAFVWHDAQVTHTERLLFGLLHAATDASALILNRCRIEDTVAKPAGFEIKATDRVTGDQLLVRTRSVVNASGAGMEAVSRSFGETCGSPAFIRGVNVVLSCARTPALAVGARDGSRFLFLVPWLGRSILGTWYDSGERPVEDLAHDLLEGGRRAFPWAELSADDIQVVHAGHVPARHGEPIYRSRLVFHADPRMVSILTAKYTTARATAELGIDHVGQALSLSLPPSVSAHTLLDKATPLQGTFAERLRLVQETEMALSPAEAVRGRLLEGSLGEKTSF
jgi:glycerol-3-phosphate dehydrogenase